MLPCTALNVTASLALVTLISFAGCAGGKPEAASPTPATTAPEKTEAKPEPAGAGGDKPGADADKPGAEGDKPAAEGDKETRTTEVIQQLVQDNRKPVRECYEKARKQIPGLKGTMTIHFVLDPEGKVKEAVLNV